MDLPAILHEQIRVHKRPELASYTTLGVGGSAPWMVEPVSKRELLLCVSELRRACLPFRVIGGGSNLLVSDSGISEIAVYTGRMAGIEDHGSLPNALRVESGASLARLISVARGKGLAGAEVLAGIPGTVGGAVVGNSGGRYGCMGDLVVAVTLVGEDGVCREMTTDSSDFGYRVSPFQDTVVVDAVVQLEEETPSTILERMNKVLSEKMLAQPLAAKSSGCIFRNPGHASSGRLIEEAGCKGERRGGASVSVCHGNFIVNDGSATASDVWQLILDIKQTVSKKRGEELQLEVKVWGDP